MIDEKQIIKDIKLLNKTEFYLLQKLDRYGISVRSIENMDEIYDAMIRISEFINPEKPEYVFDQLKYIQYRQIGFAIIRHLKRAQ